MTTSHRPTFETRKGRDLQPTSIVHSRKVAAHQQLKYRKRNDGDKQNSIDEIDAKTKFNELKQDLINREREHYSGVKTSDKVLAIEDKDEVETFEERRKRVASQTADLDDSSDDEDINESNEENEDNNENEYESEEESDSDDEAELLKELAKIKKERAEAQALKEHRSKEEEAMTNNPLLNNNTEGSSKIRKNWRQDKIFNYKNNESKQKGDDDYINDLLKSEFHQKFLNKYVK